MKHMEINLFKIVKNTYDQTPSHLNNFLSLRNITCVKRI